MTRVVMIRQNLYHNNRSSNYHDNWIITILKLLFVNSKPQKLTQFLVNKWDIGPQLQREISGLQCVSIQHGTNCRDLLNFLQDHAENDEI